MTLSIRTPEAIRRPPPPQRALAWYLFPAEEVIKELIAPLAFTAPPKLAEDSESTKRKTPYTIKYDKSVAQGDIKES
jgi:hypothetical protein